MWLLSNRETRCILVQNYLTSHAGTKISLQALATELNISRYNIQQALEILESIYQAEFSDDVPSFTFLDQNRSIQISAVQMINVEPIKKIFLNDSTKMALLNICFLEQHHSIDSVLSATNISYTLLRNYIKEMNRYLSDMDIYISKKFTLEGNEINIRRLMFETYYLHFDYETVSLEDYSFTKIPCLSDILPETVKLSPTRKKAYRITNIIWSLRLQHNHTISNELHFIDLNKAQALQPDVYNIILCAYDRLYVDLTEVDKAMELECALLTSILMNDIPAEVVPKLLTSEMNHQLQAISNIIQAEFTKLFHQEMTDDETREIGQKLVITNLQLLLMHHTIIAHPTYKTVGSTLYTISQELSEHTVTAIIDHLNVHNLENINSITIEYMTVLHHFLIATQGKYLPIASVHIDMIDLPNLKDEITYILQHHSLINVNILKDSTQNADIIISDTSVYDAHSQNIVWRDLPDDEDICNFHKIVINIIKNKVKNHRK